MLQRLFPFLIWIISIQAAGQTWQRESDLPGVERDDAVAFSIGEDTYLGTGSTPWFAPTRDFYVYRSRSASWDTITSLPPGQERQYACGFSANGLGFIFGGVQGSSRLNDLWSYDPISDSWSQRSSLPGQGRSGASCFVIGDTAYIMGGQTDSLPSTNEVWAYDIQNNLWFTRGSLPYNGIWRASSTSTGGKGYMIFGKRQTGSFPKALWEYDPIGDTWTPISLFPGYGRTYAQLSPLAGRLYLLCGMDSTGVFENDLWEYDILLDQWTELDSIPSTPRRGGVAFIDGLRAIHYSTGLNEKGQRIKESWAYFLPLGLNDPIDRSEIFVFPNPGSGRIKIQIPDSWSPNLVEIRVVNMMGKMVYDRQGHSLNRIMDLGHLDNGSFIIRITYKDRSYSIPWMLLKQ